MNILVFNCGSSSLTFKLYEIHANQAEMLLASGKVAHIGSPALEKPFLKLKTPQGEFRQECLVNSHGESAELVLKVLQTQGLYPDSFGHRFVHGGVLLNDSCLIDEDFFTKINACLPLAPLHNPNSLSVVTLIRNLYPDSLQYACFDTAFHTSIPEKAWRYAIPREMADQGGYRKYGFHGLSYQFITRASAGLLNTPAQQLNLVACHLGTGGASVTAIAGGKSQDTSMGYSPLDGLVMSTRCGDLDPEIILSLVRDQGYTPEQLEKVFNKDSGLIGLSGATSDLFELIQMSSQGNLQAKLAVDVYVHRLKRHIGAALASLDHVDALVFTDDIGARCWQLREMVCSGFKWMGIFLDSHLNQVNDAKNQPVISASDSPIKILIQETDEEKMILEEGRRLLAASI